jgi:hypothetical protein
LNIYSIFALRIVYVTKCEELSAVVSHDFSLRIKADFDERVFSAPNEHIEFVELPPGATIANILLNTSHSKSACVVMK